MVTVDGFINAMNLNLGKLQKTGEDRGVWCAMVEQDLVTEQQLV